jgi:hypothetical protein
VFLRAVSNAGCTTMASSFLRDLRRRSRASFRSDRSPEHSETQWSPPSDPQRTSEQLRPPDVYNTDSSSDASRGTVVTGGSVTPPSNHGSESRPEATPLQKAGTSDTVPSLQPLAPSNRNSVSGMSGLGAPATLGYLNPPKSDFEPRFLNAPGARPVCHCTASICRWMLTITGLPEGVHVVWDSR